MLRITLRRSSSPTIAEYVAPPDVNEPETGEFHTGYMMCGAETLWGRNNQNHEGTT
jgi:hypothetical protein